MKRALWISVSGLIASAAAAQAKEGLVIAQSGTIGGAHVIYLEPQNAIKVFDLHTQVSLIAKKPDWQLVLSNARTKTWCHVVKAVKSPLSNAPLWIMTGQDIDRLQWTPAGTLTIAGQQATDFKSLLLDLDTGVATTKRPAHIYALPAVVLPKPVANAVCQFLRMPMVGSVPLKVLYANGAGAPMKVLDTKSIQTKQITDSEFTIPNSYRQMTTQEQVIQDASKQQAIEDMVQSLGH